MIGSEAAVLLPNIRFKEVYHAFNSTRGCPDRRWRSPLASEQLRPDAGVHQEYPECCRGHCGSLVAAERLWTLHLPLQDPCGKLTVCSGNAPKDFVGNEVPCHEYLGGEMSSDCCRGGEWLIATLRS